jgi:hypothetical protein
MRALWPTVIGPLLDVYRPATTVELAAEDASLADLLEAAAERFDGSFLRDAATAAGPHLALVHGELNWHAVSEKLRRLEEMAKAGNAPYPLTLVHGVDWPTARRDSYPDPAAVPVGARQPHREVAGVEQALDAHELRNGVLTAVEDFLAECGKELDSIYLPGLGGTAILVSPGRLEGRGSSRLMRLLDGWRLSPQALAQVAAIEAERMRAAARAERMRAELEAARTGLDAQSSAERDGLRERIEEMAEREAGLTAMLARREARLAALEAEAGENGAAGSLDVSADPQPVDRREILSASGRETDGARVQVLVRLAGDPEEMRRCLWSLLSRGDRPMSLTFLDDGAAAGPLREIAEGLAAARPSVRIGAQAPDDRAGWRLLIEEPVTFGHLTICNLFEASESGESRRVAAAAPGAPAWAGMEAAALLAAGRRAKRGAGRQGAPCVLVPPGLELGGPEEVALDAAVEFHGETETGGEEPAAAYASEEALARALGECLREPLSIAYLLPGLPPGGSGGSHSVVQEARMLAAIGAPTSILIPAGSRAAAEEVYPEAADLFRAYPSAAELGDAVEGFDVLVATEAPSAPLVSRHVRDRPDVLGAYYVQDYEPFFSPAGGPSADAALLSYRQASGLLLFAKTHWIANAVAAAHEIPVAKVRPSLDRTTFHAEGRREGASALRVMAMIRPRTPRRRPAETLALLRRLKAELGDAVEARTFGCGAEELAAFAPAPGVEHLGLLSQSEVADALRACDLFLDLSSYQAFGRTGLEAMACGAVPVLPRRGGVGEYAVDGENALILDSEDEDAVLAAVAALLGDRERLERLRAAGAVTATGFSVLGAAISQYACFAARRRARAGGR